MTPPDPHIVSVRLDDLLTTWSTPPRNEHIISVKLQDLVTDAPGKLVQEGKEQNKIKYRFGPYLVDDTDSTPDTRLKQGNDTTFTDTPAFWSTEVDEKGGEMDLISFEKEPGDKDELATLVYPELDRQGVGKPLSPKLSPASHGTTVDHRPGLTTVDYHKSAHGMSTTVYHQPSPSPFQHSPSKVPLFIPPVSRSYAPKVSLLELTPQKQSAKKTRKVPLFKPTPQQQEQHTSQTGRPEDIQSHIAEKLAKTTSFKLPTKSVVTIKRPMSESTPSSPVPYNVQAAPFTPTIKPSTTPSSPSTFNVDAAPFTPSTEATSPFNVHATAFTPSTTTLATQSLDINAAPFTPSTGSTTPPFNIHAPDFTPSKTPSLDVNIPSSSLNIQAASFEPKAEDPTLCNVETARLIPTTDALLLGTAPPPDLISSALNPSAPAFEPISVSSSSSSHSSHTTNDAHTPHILSAKSDSPNSESDLLDLSMDSFSDRRVE